MNARTKAMVQAAKAAKEGGAKKAAMEAAATLAAETKAKGATVFVARLGDGADPAALKDAAQVAFKEGVACALFSADPAKGKAMCYVSVPPALGAQIDVKGWLDACCGPIEGKGGGGKNGVAQGQGNKLEGLDEAISRAQAFAGIA